MSHQNKEPLNLLFQGKINKKKSTTSIMNMWWWWFTCCCVWLFFNPLDCSLPASSVHGILQARILELVACISPRDLPNPGTELRSPTLQADSLRPEPPGKPNNTGMGSLSFFQGVFPTQESNRGLLHCRWILYQLSYQGSPSSLLNVSICISKK